MESVHPLHDQSLESWKSLELPFLVLHDGSVEVFFHLGDDPIEYRFIWAEAYGAWCALDCTPQKTRVLFAGILASYPARKTRLVLTVTPKQCVTIGSSVVSIEGRKIIIQAPLSTSIHRIHSSQLPQ